MGVKENTQLSKVDGQNEVDELEEEVELERERKASRHVRDGIPDQHYQTKAIRDNSSWENTTAVKIWRREDEKKKARNRNIHIGLNINY